MLARRFKRNVTAGTRLQARTTTGGRIWPLSAVGAVIAGIVLVTAACGGGAEAPGAEPTTGGEEARPDGGDTTFEVSMGDNHFEPSELTVKSGELVTFNLTNDGAAVHNKRITGPDGAYDTDDDAVSDPELVTAGDAGVLLWVAPEEPGTYDFRCDFHASDMTGIITVQ